MQTLRSKISTIDQAISAPLLRLAARTKVYSLAMVNSLHIEAFLPLRRLALSLVLLVQILHP